VRDINLALLVERVNIKKKMKIVEDLHGMIEKYDTIGIIGLFKVRAMQLQQLAKTFRDDLRLKVIKNSLISRALKTSTKTGLDQLQESLEGSNMLLFSNLDPFTLAILFDKNKMIMTAKAGDVAPKDIVIYAGNTGLPPGPVMSELHSVGIRTRIDVGSVWVIRDTTVVKKGEVIEARVAGVLSKLGVKPLEVGLTIKAAYSNGLIFTRNQLQPKLEEVLNQIEDAAAQAFNLSFNAAYLTSATTPLLLQRAFLHAKNVAVQTNYFTADTIREIVLKGYTHMIGLSTRLSQINQDAAPPESTS
jgi:large subunit ribosomal protein L10